MIERDALPQNHRRVRCLVWPLCRRVSEKLSLLASKDEQVSVFSTTARAQMRAIPTCFLIEDANKSRVCEGIVSTRPLYRTLGAGHPVPPLTPRPQNEAFTAAINRCATQSHAQNRGLYWLHVGARLQNVLPGNLWLPDECARLREGGGDAFAAGVSAGSDRRRGGAGAFLPPPVSPQSGGQ